MSREGEEEDLGPLMSLGEANSYLPMNELREEEEEEMEPPTTPLQETEAGEEHPPQQEEGEENVLSIVNLDALKNKEVVNEKQKGKRPRETEPEKKTKKKRKKDTSDYEEEEEDTKKKDKLKGRQLLWILNFQKMRFPEAYKTVVKGRDIHAASEEKLNKWIEGIKMELSFGTSCVISDWSAVVATTAVEKALVMGGARVKGLGELCRKDPEFQTIYDELFVEYMHLITVSPKAKIIMYLLKQAYILDQQNRSYDDMGGAIDRAGKLPTIPPPPMRSSPVVNGIPIPHETAMLYTPNPKDPSRPTPIQHDPKKCRTKDCEKCEEIIRLQDAAHFGAPEEDDEGEAPPSDDTNAESSEEDEEYVVSE